jgi:hypothetical protein
MRRTICAVSTDVQRRYVWSIGRARQAATRSRRLDMYQRRRAANRLVATRMEPTYGDYFGIVTLSDGGFRVLWPKVRDAKQFATVRECSRVAARRATRQSPRRPARAPIRLTPSDGPFEIGRPAPQVP